MIKRVMSLVGCLLLFVGWQVTQVNAQNFAKVGTSGAHFLDIGFGARGVAMGNAYTAVGGMGATATYWNPATLGFSKGMSFAGTYVNYFADITYGSAAVTMPVRNLGTFGLSFSYLNSGQMDETTVTEPDGTGNTFTAGDAMIGVTYARALTDKFSFGGNVKWIQENLAGLTASALAFDLSTLYYTGFRSLRLGMSVRNFGPDLEFNGTYTDYDNGVPIPTKSQYTPYHMPLTFKVGLAYDFFQNPGMHQLTLAADAIHPNDSLERILLGGEYTFMHTLALRGGFISNHDTAGPTFGVGVMFSNFHVDYSYSSFGVLKNVHQFTIMFSS